MVESEAVKLNLSDLEAEVFGYTGSEDSRIQ